jgi:hypothetical protein
LESGFFNSSDSRLLRSVVVDRSNELREFAPIIVDAIAPPNDFLPPMGRSIDENSMYTHIWESVKDRTERAKHWKDLQPVEPMSKGNLVATAMKAKL